MRGKNMFGKGRFGEGMVLKTEVVNGTCPTCTSQTIFIALCPELYRCTNCGADLEQKVNGVIQYIPATVQGSVYKPILKPVEDGPKQT